MLENANGMLAFIARCTEFKSDTVQWTLDNYCPVNTLAVISKLMEAVDDGNMKHSPHRTRP